jgi:hypothetical protein
MSPASLLRERPREPRETPRPRGPRPPSGEDPAHPANPARPYRGAGSRAGSGGLAATPTSRPVGTTRLPRGPTALGGGVVRGRVAGPGSPPKHPQHPRLPEGVTLSDENAPSRPQPCRHQHPAGLAAQKAAHCPSAGLSNRPLPCDLKPR